MYIIVLLYDPITDIIMPSTIMLSLYKSNNKIFQIQQNLLYREFLNQAHTWFLRMASVRECQYVYVCVCLCVCPRGY